MKKIDAKMAQHRGKKVRTGEQVECQHSHGDCGNTTKCDVACRKKKKIIIEIMYSEELRCHLGYDKNAQQTGGRTNYRNGTMKKIVRSCNGPIELDVPRDRNGTFEPKIIARYQSDISHIEDRIMAVCEDGISLQDIAATVRKIYGNDVPDELLSRITARICAEVREHQP